MPRPSTRTSAGAWATTSLIPGGMATPFKTRSPARRARRRRAVWTFRARAVLIQRPDRRPLRRRPRRPRRRPHRRRLRPLPPLSTPPAASPAPAPRSSRSPSPRDQRAPHETPPTPASPSSRSESTQSSDSELLHTAHSPLLYCCAPPFAPRERRLRSLSLSPRGPFVPHTAREPTESGTDPHRQSPPLAPKEPSINIGFES